MKIFELVEELSGVFRPDPRTKPGATPQAAPQANQPQMGARVTAPLRTMTINQPFKGLDHQGVDLRADNEPIYAPEDGRVVSGTGYNSGMGNYVKLNSRQGEHRFMHLSRITAPDGAVRQGDVLGYTGNTGRSYGPHLHWEFRSRTQGLMDPMTLLK